MGDRDLIGKEAPDFTLQDTSGQPWRLSAHRGKVVALIFYPKDDTPVCTAQMCSMRDRWEDYQATGAEVAGISIGSVESHKKFAGRHRLPQRLLADEKGEVARLYDMKSILGTTKRGVIVIDPKGIIRYQKTLFPLLRPSDEEVLEAIRQAMAEHGSS